MCLNRRRFSEKKAHPGKEEQNRDAPKKNLLALMRVDFGKVCGLPGALPVSSAQDLVEGNQIVQPGKSDRYQALTGAVK